MYKHSIDLLLEACGATGPVEVVVSGPGKSAVQCKSLFLPLAIIGREQQADLALADPRVSRRHAYLQMIDGRLFVVDLLSRTGTFLDGTQTGAAWVQRDQIVQVADHSLQFFSDAPGAGHALVHANPLTAQTLHDYDEPEIALECTAGAEKPFLWRMDSVLALLGRRAAGMGLGVNDPNASGFHCSVLRTPAGVWVFDLLGQDGTLLNGRRIRWAQLGDRDELQIGGHQFRVLITPGRRGTSPYRNTNGVKSSINGSEGDHFGYAKSIHQTPVRAGALVAFSPSQPKPMITQDFLVSLFDQFATVQNQMFDQFQGAMNVMVDMFSDMQREQVGLIRKEVDRLHLITEEIHELQTELVSRSAATASAKNPSRSKVQSHMPESQAKVPLSAENASVPDMTSAVPVEVQNEPPAPTGFPLPVQEELGDCETHVWLYDKISELQRQRQGRFRRIFSFLSGK